MAASLVLKPARFLCPVFKQKVVRISLLRCLSHHSQVNGFSDVSYTNRTHLCGELRTEHANTSVTLCGWLQYHRLNGAILVLRDWYGMIQLIVPQSQIEHCKDFPLETVLEVTGEVALRPPGQENKAMPTGEVEVKVDSIKVLNTCVPSLPFDVRDYHKVKESLRIKHRYLDLRLPSLQANLRLRSKFVMAMRKFLADCHDFVEVETPTLFRRTPGGAREFIVPTHTPDKFYTLPQSPQQFKQLLMVGGLDRYFQVARCYRDESSRSDRQPEFTQIDIEMSFVTQQDIMTLVEDMLESSWPEGKGKISVPFPRMSYADAMSTYGSDKPDMCFDWQIQDVTNILRERCPPVLQSLLNDEKTCIQAVKIPGASKQLSNKDIEMLKEKAVLVARQAVKVVSNKVKDFENWGSGVGQHLTPEQKHQLSVVLGTVQEGDLVLMASGLNYDPHQVLGEARLKCADLMESKGVPVRRKGFSFLWVDNFPLFLPKEDGGDGWESAHHPFTAPHPDDDHLLYSKPELRAGEFCWQGEMSQMGNLEGLAPSQLPGELFHVQPVSSIAPTVREDILLPVARYQFTPELNEARSQHYDLVLNGNEIGGGSIRIHNSTMQRHVLTGILKEDSRELEHLLEALDCGCPPHGGIALGLDRLVAILCNASSIRDVIAFPKISNGRDPLSDAPAPVSEAELDYYNIQLKKRYQSSSSADSDLD